ncbi:trypsin-like peptidase domain-containing protein [Actinoallomurus soli]|uniref:trypsin-like peptidase domain-containing protein n=1 Tax=Actinoallomurus soli TaxID=2952535 RepID=UPI002092A492|nr:trypsin-like peptidase domain-containing protein [Actinoallomurus soli]MCO5972002.1 trypsin-like peptidase domain-containing protein [Actinoallomurus soli]
MTDDSRAPGGSAPDDGRVRGPNTGDEDGTLSLTDQLLVSGPPRYEGMAPPDPGASSAYGEDGRPYGPAGGSGQGGPTTPPEQNGRPGFGQGGPGYAGQGGSAGFEQGGPGYTGQNGSAGYEPSPPGFAGQGGSAGFEQGGPGYTGQNGSPGAEEGRQAYGQGAPAYGYGGRPGEQGAPRPIFTPHDQPPPSSVPYAWGTPPGGPGGTTPNWAPVPPVRPNERSGPVMGVFVAVAVAVALIAGALGAGIGVVATRDSGPKAVDLGGGSSTGAKNRAPGSVAGIARRVVPSVVMIKVANATEGGAGTGFIVNGGYIVTNNHVVAPAAQGGTMQVVYNDGKTTSASIVGRDPNSDIAVIKPATLDGRPALLLGDSDGIAVGDPVIAIGSPLGLAGTVTTGIVSALNRPVTTSGESGESAYISAVQTDAAINPGNSGGPLVDSQGRVIGVNSAIATLGGQTLGGDKQQSGSIGLGFAIPSNQVKRVAEQLIKGGKVTHPIIGACMDMSYQGNGARISTSGSATQCKGGAITPGGPAEKAGLKAGDVITSFAGKAIGGADELIVAIRSKSPGDTVPVVFTRGGQSRTVQLTLAAGN